MTSPELCQGAPRSPLSPAPEQEVPRRRFEVMKTSTPGLGARSKVLPLTGAARTGLSFTPPAPTGPLPETIEALQRCLSDDA